MQAEGLTKLVEHNNKKVAEKQLEGLKTELAEMITQDPPIPVDDCLAAVKAKKAEFALADAELVKVRCLRQLIRLICMQLSLQVPTHMLPTSFANMHAAGWCCLSAELVCSVHCMPCITLCCCCADHFHCAD